MKNIVVFTGSGISAESGIRTFRDSDGLWEEYNVMDVATPQAWARDPKLVQRFYNERRKQIMEAEPNAAHKALAELESKHRVSIITQNIDDLHERAGSGRVLHLHGEILKARSSGSPNLIYELDHWEIPDGAVCEKGFPLRPHIVWFGEAVPMMDPAIQMVSTAEILIIVGTSLEVYPAASLIHYAPENCQKYLIDPAAKNIQQSDNITVIKAKAGEALPALVRQMLHSL